MLELVLMAALAVPQNPPSTYTPPRPTYTPPPSSNTSTPQTVSPTLPPKPAAAPSPDPAPRQNWRDKMWERYKQQSGSN